MEIRIQNRGGDTWIEVIDNKQILRAVLFSEEARDDLDENVHNQVITQCKNKLLADTVGPTLKVKADANRTTFSLIPLDTKT